MPKSNSQDQSIQKQLEQDFILALKEKKPSLDVLRMIKAAVKNAEITKKDKLTDQEIMIVLQKEKKQRQDSVEEFTKGQRNDLVDKEKFEIEVIEKYLPKAMSNDEIKQIILEEINNTSASNSGDMGKVMGQVMPKLKGRADGEKVSQIVKEELIKISP